jgi:hypothetical protein
MAQATEKEWLFELNNSILGIWRNEDMSLTFSGDGINDGTLIIKSNYRPEATGTNYRILIKEGLPHLLLITTQEQGPLIIQEYLLVKCDPTTQKRLVFTAVGGGLPVGLDRVD